MDINIEINNEALNDSQRDVIQETVNGLNFIALNAERCQLTQIARLVRAVMVDIVSWSKHLHMQNEQHGEPNIFENYMIDVSMITAFEFLAKFALLDDDQLKEDILKTLSNISQSRQNSQIMN